MPLVRFDEDEWYPCISVMEEPLPERGHINVSAELLKRWQDVQEQWSACQEEMQAASTEADHRRGDYDAEGNRIIPVWPKPGA